MRVILCSNLSTRLNNKLHELTFIEETFGGKLQLKSWLELVIRWYICIIAYSKSWCWFLKTNKYLMAQAFIRREFHSTFWNIAKHWSPDPFADLFCTRHILSAYKRVAMSERFWQISRILSFNAIQTFKADQRRPTGTDVMWT